SPFLGSKASRGPGARGLRSSSSPYNANNPQVSKTEISYCENKRFVLCLWLMDTIEKIDWTRIRVGRYSCRLTDETDGFSPAAGGMGNRPGGIGFASSKWTASRIHSGRRRGGSSGAGFGGALSPRTAKGPGVIPVAV